MIVNLQEFIHITSLNFSKKDYFIFRNFAKKDYFIFHF